MSKEEIILEDYSESLRESYSILDEEVSFDMNFNLEEDLNFINKDIILETPDILEINPNMLAGDNPLLVDDRLVNSFLDSLYYTVRSKAVLDETKTIENIENFIKTYNMEEKGLRLFDPNNSFDRQELNKVIKNSKYKKMCINFLKNMSKVVLMLTVAVVAGGMNSQIKNKKASAIKSGAKKIKIKPKEYVKMFGNLFKNGTLKNGLFNKKTGKMALIGAGSSIINTVLDKVNTYQFQYKDYTLLSIYFAKTVSQTSPFTPGFIVFVEKDSNKIVLEKINLVGKHCD